MLTVLIDRDGLVWDGDAMSLRREFSARCGNRTLVEFLIRNLGFVRFQSNGESCAIKVAPSRLTFKAYAAVSRLLEEKPPRRISLSWFDDDWHHRIYGDSEGFLKQLLRLTIENNAQTTHKYLSRNRPLDTLESGHPFKQLLSVWQQASNRFDLSDFPQLLNDCFGRKFVVVERAEETSSLIFSQIGDGLQMYHNGWTRQLVGQRVEDQPDLQYAKWVGNAWRNAILSGVPTLAEVDAVVANPSEGSSRRIPYARFTLPCPSPTNQQRLLSVSLVDHSIDLRVEVDHEAKRVID